MISAYKRNFNSAHNVRVNIVRETGEIEIFSCLQVVDKVLNPQQEIHLEEAKKKDPHYELGDTVEFEVTQNFEDCSTNCKTSCYSAN